MIPARELPMWRSLLFCPANSQRFIGKAHARGADICVRINRPLELAVQDIAAAIQTAVCALVLPKVSGPEHVQLLAEVVQTCESAAGLCVGYTKFVAIVESAAAVEKLGAIAVSSPRLVARLKPQAGSSRISPDLTARK